MRVNINNLDHFCMEWYDKGYNSPPLQRIYYNYPVWICPIVGILVVIAFVCQFVHTGIAHSIWNSLFFFLSGIIIIQMICIFCIFWVLFICPVQFNYIHSFDSSILYFPKALMHYKNSCNSCVRIVYVVSPMFTELCNNSM